MFKFATNKFSSHHHNNNTNSNSTSTSAPQSSSSSNNSAVATALSKHAANDTHTSSSMSSAMSKRRQIQKDLFGFNKIADKGFPSKPSCMDYDRKLKLLAIGTKNGDIRIYGQPNTKQQQLSSYQDVHPFPIQRLLFIQGQHQLITLSERVVRNDLTNKGESQLYLILWQIPTATSSDVVNGSASANNNIIEKIKEYQIDPKAIANGTKLSAITLLNDNSHLFMGFETGDVYVFNVTSFELVPGVINKDYILKNIPDQTSTASTTNTTGTNTVKKKLTQLGAVESICHHPRQLTKLLIAYERGLWIIFDFIKNQIDQINQTQQQLESAVFYQYGECVATAHSDGSFILWDLIASTSVASAQPSETPTTCTSNSAPNIVYGPYPCKPVTKCLVKTYRNDQPLVIFSGGCPRVNYSDKITISVIQGETSHVCFDFTSKLIDFFTIDKPSVEKNQQLTAGSNPSTNSNMIQQYDNPQALFVLLEEEFVAIDLMTEGWPQFKLPYLYSVHSSAIICTHYVNGIGKKFYEKLKAYGSINQSPNDPSEMYSEREWPIAHHHHHHGNQIVESANETKDLLLTGHEDGSVRFWDVTNMSMTLLYRLKTNEYFQTDSTPLDDPCDDKQQDEENWPPFRKVGTFDPYSDDPKLGIQKIFLCAQRQILVVAGTAGQVLIMCLNDEVRELTQNSIRAHKINIIGVSPEVESHFVWKGHEPLQTRQIQQQQSVKLQPGYQLHSLIQLYPPATISALTLNSDWQLVAVGTSHGFVLYDYLSARDLLIRCTLDPAALLLASQNESGGIGTGTISRRKSLKKSLRESFRKLRRGRSQKQNNKTIKQDQPLLNRNMINNTNQMRVEHLDDEMNGGDGGHRPIERQVESREFKPMDDIPPSVIRYMYFVRTYITNNQQQTNSLWVGTNTGIIYIYALQFLLNSAQQQQQSASPLSMTIPSTSTRANQTVNCLLAKEMRLKHRAPVVHIQVIDQHMNPLPMDSLNSNSNQTQGPNDHKVIICSEEQFKVFQLPTLKPVCKFKLTAVEGARVRRIGYNCYTSKTDPKYTEHCLSCLSNLGDLSVYSLPQLKRQVQIQCMKQQDINAITSFVFSKQGQAFYLQSPSEFVHISMSAKDSPSQLTCINSTNQTGSSLSKKNSTKSSNTSTVQQQQAANNNNLAVKSKSNTTTTPVTATTSSPPTTTATTTNTQSPPVPAPRSTSSASSSSSATVQSPPQSSRNSNNEPTSPVNQNNRPKENSLIISKQQTVEVNQNKNEVITSPVKDDLDMKDRKYQQHQQQQQQHQHSDNDDEDMAKKKLLDTSTDSSMTSSVAMEKKCDDIDYDHETKKDLKVKLDDNQTAPTLLTNINITTTNNNNNSLLTSNQSDSFNVSSSGYNGSITTSNVSCNLNNLTNNFIDMSLDSVVDRFNDEYHDVSTKRIPSSIDESSTSDCLNAKMDTVKKIPNLIGTNGSSKSTSSSSTATTASSSAVCSSSSSSSSSNIINDEDYNTISSMAPQKASSPLIKQQQQPLMNGSSRAPNNKIEQVTKRIENGSKLEYKETVID